MEGPGVARGRHIPDDRGVPLTQVRDMCFTVQTIQTTQLNATMYVFLG